MSLKSGMLILSLIMMSSSYAQAIQKGNAKIEACSGSSSEAVCVGKILNQKLNRILKKINKGSSGGGGNSLGLIAADIKLTDDSDCSGSKSSGAILAESLAEVKSQCERIANGYSNGFQNIDGIVVNGTCYDIENSSDYQMANLSNICAAKVISAN